MAAVGWLCDTIVILQPPNDESLADDAAHHYFAPWPDPRRRGDYISADQRDSEPYHDRRAWFAGHAGSYVDLAPLSVLATASLDWRLFRPPSTLGLPAHALYRG